MNKYESIIIIKPNVNGDEIENIITKVESIIKENGNIILIQNLGLKKLAYEVHKFKEGYYVQFYFNTEAERVAELERYYRITEDIIKFITVKHDRN